MKLDRLVLAVASAVMLASAVPAASQPASSAISDLTPFSGPGHVIINDAGRAAWVPDVEYNTGVREEGPDGIRYVKGWRSDWSRAVDLPHLQDALARGLTRDIDEYGTRIGLNPYDVTKLGPYLRPWSDEDIRRANEAVAAAKRKQSRSAVRGGSVLLGPIGAAGAALAAPGARGAGGASGAAEPMTPADR
jgi:hypothetical protein